MAIVYDRGRKEFVLSIPITDEDIRHLTLVSDFLGLNKNSRAFIGDVIEAHYRRCQREGTLREMPVH